VPKYGTCGPEPELCILVTLEYTIVMRLNMTTVSYYIYNHIVIITVQNNHNILNTNHNYGQPYVPGTESLLEMMEAEEI
jgi:hypothetical protein